MSIPTDLEERARAMLAAELNSLAEAHPHLAWTFEPKHTFSTDTGKAALRAIKRALSLPTADPAREAALPRLTAALIEAAAEAHYGKERARSMGGAQGIDMTVDGRNWTFEQAFRRMWKGIRSALSLEDKSDE